MLGAGTTNTGQNYNYGQSIPPTGSFTQVNAGSSHTCGIRTNGATACWGWNQFGQTTVPPQAAPPDDLDPPLVQIRLTPDSPDGSNGWYRSPVSAQPEASDASGVYELRCALDPASPPVSYDDLPVDTCSSVGGSISTDGAHTFYAAAMDIWGNKSAPVWAEFQLDATSPVLTCPAAGPFLLGERRAHGRPGGRGRQRLRAG